MADKATKKIVTFGEAMLRLVPPHFRRIEQTDSLLMNPGGSEFNVAVDIARLGGTAAWVSVLPDNPMGRFIRNKAREHGVDTSRVLFSDRGRAGIYFVEYGTSPRASKVYYDRENSSVAFGANKIDWKTALEGAAWFHTSGITPALSGLCAEAARSAIETAKAGGATVSYDLNYRKKLWTPAEALKTTEKYADKIDCCIGNEEDFQKVLGVELDAKKEGFEEIDLDYYKGLAAKVQESFGFTYVAISLRESISVLRNDWRGLLYTGGKAYISKKYELELIDRVGGGDSFSAGLIYTLSSGKDPQAAVEFAAAFSALKHTIWGDINIVDLPEVEALLASGSARIER
ncbi:MAG: PfkB family carbohydrate kinase [Spirochaetia bacterium]